MEFWNSDNERMFIKILIDSKSVKKIKLEYTLNNYLEDFRSLTEFILAEMIKHKFIRKYDVKVLSNEFLNPLFLMQLETLLGYSDKSAPVNLLDSHAEFFWKAIKK